MKVLEIYDTVQGEGPNVGKPTTFVRFAGCNMRCPGWPCDTPYSIWPKEWRTQFTEMSPDEIINDLIANHSPIPSHVCITGGEPLLQHKGQMREFMNLLWERGWTFDIFSNGSRSFKDYPLLATETATIIQDWKLTGSGEAKSYLDQRRWNLDALKFKDAVKFVVSSDEDLEEADQVINDYVPDNFPPRVYIGPAWDLYPAEKIVEFILRRHINAYLNLQTHKYVFPGRDRGI